MKRSSSGSEPGAGPGPEGAGPASGGLFDGVLARGGVRDAVGDEAWLRAMLEVESALARALARAGLADAEAAAAIERACSSIVLDAGELGRDAAASGNPVVPLVRVLRAAVPGRAADAVHHGATSQDVLDTAAMLVARRACLVLAGDLAAAADAAAGLARANRDTVIAGRTLLQHAAPTTFGLKAAGWMTAIDEAADRLDDVRGTRLAVQFGGAVGTLAVFGDDGIAVLGHLAEELGLTEPTLPWHTDRTRIADLATALGIVAGTTGKVALDLALLAQTEVDEASDPDPERGGSSTMPNKRNPVAAVSALACARQAPGLVATLLGSMVQEHERAAGAWHAEWGPFRALFEAVGSAAAWTRDALEHLRVDAGAMRRNVDLTVGRLMAERVEIALVPALGRTAAREAVAAASAESGARGRPLLDVLLERDDVRRSIEPAALAGLFDPAGYLGSAGAFVDRALAAHGARRPESA